VEYCDEHVFVFVHDHIFGTTRPIFTKFLCVLPMAVVRTPSGGIVMLRTSGFMDDVTLRIS